MYLNSFIDDTKYVETRNQEYFLEIISIFMNSATLIMSIFIIKSIDIQMNNIDFSRMGF